MKKIAGIVAVILILLAMVYFLNPDRIYKLTETTAQFIPQQPIPEGLVSLKARDCGACHVEIYQEWQDSLHSQAYRDPFFKAYLRKDRGDPTCLICHVPLQNQSPVILSSQSGQFDDLKITHNPDFDAELQIEGVTCSGCHVRNGTVYGPYAAETMDAPHPVAYDERFLNKSICNQCHDVPSKDFSLMDEGICNTGMESDQGPWAARGFICQDCHMPRIDRALVPGYPLRKGRKHTWPGGYSSQQLQTVFGFKAERIQQAIKITVTNSGAGHKAPTGDPDRFIVLEFLWIDDSGQSTVLETIKFKRQVIWQPVMFVLYDNRLAPGDSTERVVDLPEKAGQLFVNGTYHVMTEWSLQRLIDNYGLNPADLNADWDIRRPFITQQQIDIEGG